MRRIALALALVLLLTPIAAAQSPSIVDTATALGQAIEDRFAAVDSKNAEQDAKLADLEARVAALEEEPPPPPPPPAPECSDGVDNDADGDVDLTDDGCADAADNDESDDPPPPPDDDPPTQPNIDQVGNWTCTGFQDRALVRVLIPEGSTDEGVNLRADCHGEIDRLEITMFSGHDVLDINNASPAPHDLRIGGGFVRARGAAGGAHQDCIQLTNGTAAARITIVGVTFSGCDTQYLISSPDGAGVFRAQDVVCDGCTFLPEHDGLVPTHTQVSNYPGCSGNLCSAGPANAMLLTGANVGTLNSLVCVGPRFGHGVRTDGNPNAIGWVDNTPGSDPYDAVPAPGSGNELALPGDPRCAASG